MALSPIESDSGKAQVTPLLSNSVLSRLELLRINARRRFTDKRRGEHLAGRQGTSNEFCDYRDYTPGDDVRFVDWNVFARLNRPYLKLYHEEEEMHVLILVDTSGSMGFEGKIEKAKQLAAAFGVMGLLGTERVSVYALDATEGPLNRLRPCRGRANMMKLFAFVESIEGNGRGPLEDAVEAVLRHHTGRGLVVVLSDFLTFGNLKRAFNRLFSSGLEVYGLQILGPTEIDPEMAGDARLVDSELASMLDITAAGSLIPLYQEHRLAYERNVALLCRQRAGRFLAISSDDSAELVLFDLLLRKGWIQ